jgi:hypothetical protein
MINVSTKQLKYANEQEVRAMLWLVDPHETGNRHIDLDNRFHTRPIYPTAQPEGVHRLVDLRTLIERVIVSPFAEPNAFERDRGASQECRTFLSGHTIFTDCWRQPVAD